ncbi:hypothetical protein CLV51_106221 [Chitinophaga niastensis]|uniref:Uncharacterized protein n=1 Tax=Chitinophaga niastensis TaxID=536980 RepID=A0A2P8HDP2_CHINA|nr:hypothetical protein [Chitinophaga niastensis]PSL44355.1 hypothetical protein CLV51_106221 [Chitinophaga niastensis]
MKLTTEKKLSFLMGYTVVSSLVFIFFMVSSFREKDKEQKLDELTVKRINVIGEDGSYRMVISNEVRQHPGRVVGKNLPKRDRPAGLIFFNNEGDECGGLTYTAETKNGKASNDLSFTMDQYHEDQVVQILNAEEFDNDKVTIKRGVVINDYPAGGDIYERVEKIKAIQQIKDTTVRAEKLKALAQAIGVKNRLFIGRTRENSSGLFLADPTGKVRMKIYVDDKGNPKIETLNDKGEFKDYLAGK